VTRRFSTTVGARKLIDILRSMPADQIVSLTANGSKLTLQGGKSRFTLQTLPAEDFPLVNEAVDFGPAFSVPQKVLKGLIDQVHFAMAVHDIRYYLNGILFVAEGKTLTLVATDGTAWPWPRPSWRPTCPSRRSSCRARRCWSCSACWAPAKTPSSCSSPATRPSSARAWSS
jgi:hypothetical protein